MPSGLKKAKEHELDDGGFDTPSRESRFDVISFVATPTMAAICSFTTDDNHTNGG